MKKSHSIRCAGYRGVGQPFDESACDCDDLKSIPAEIAVAIASIGRYPPDGYERLTAAIRGVLDRFGIKHLQREKNARRPTTQEHP